MDGIAALDRDTRARLFEETAARLGIGRAAIIEKDFWVCWTLRRLFALQNTQKEAHPVFVFKGGTSLSKVFGLIQRFSEDIDLSLDWHGLGFTGERDPAKAGTSRRKRLLEELRDTCESYIASTLVPALRKDFATVLGPDTQGKGIGAPAPPWHRARYRVPHGRWRSIPTTHGRCTSPTHRVSQARHTPISYTCSRPCDSSSARGANSGR